MSFDYSSEFAKFQKEWKMQENIMREEGIEEKVILELYKFSHQQFKDDRNYALSLCDFTHLANDDDAPKEKKRKSGMAEQPLEFDEPFNGLMQTDNESLLKGLKKLSVLELQVITLFCEKGMDLKQISNFMGQKYDATQKQFYRAKNKLKKLF